MLLAKHAALRGLCPNKFGLGITLLHHVLTPYLVPSNAGRTTPNSLRFHGMFYMGTAACMQQVWGARDTASYSRIKELGFQVQKCGGEFIA